MKNLPAILLTVSVSLMAITADAEKFFYSLPNLIYSSDIIVAGNITSVSGDTSYLFTIDHIVKGKTDRCINVKMFKNWVCDVRLKKALPGQSLFLFLTKKGNDYEIVGGSDG